MLIRLSSFVYVPNVSDHKKPSTSILWEQVIAKISPKPERTVVFEYKHGISAKEPFPWLLERGATLFIELFDHQLPRRQGLDVWGFNNRLISIDVFH